MKYRSRTDIITTILRSAAGGATKTRIMYGSYLSYAQLKEYLSFLLERELIVYEEGSSLYKPSEKGLSLLQACEGMNEMMTLDGEKTVVEYA